MNINEFINECAKIINEEVESNFLPNDFKFFTEEYVHELLKDNNIGWYVGGIYINIPNTGKTDKYSTTRIELRTLKDGSVYADFGFVRKDLKPNYSMGGVTSGYMDVEHVPEITEDNIRTILKSGIFQIVANKIKETQLAQRPDNKLMQKAYEQFNSINEKTKIEVTDDTDETRKAEYAKKSKEYMDFYDKYDRMGKSTGD